MKELSIEEKAKRYDEALEKAKRYYDEYKTRDNILYVEDIEDIFPELKESKEEKIRKNIIATIHLYYGEPLDDEAKEMIAWLEEQGEHAKFCDSIQVGDKVTRNEDGVLVNLSQLNRVANKDEKKGEQKPAEWSEEDEAIYYGVIETEQYMLDVVDGIKKFDVGNISIKEECTRELNWLKSFKDRYTWKPSDYELEVLKLAAEKDGTCLMGLYEQLKKLREE